MKTVNQIAAEIVELELASSKNDYNTWNGRFNHAGGTTTIVINGSAVDFTENYNMLPRDEKGFLDVSAFGRIVKELRTPVMTEWYENN